MPDSWHLWQFSLPPLHSEETEEAGKVGGEPHTHREQWKVSMRLNGSKSTKILHLNPMSNHQMLYLLRTNQDSSGENHPEKQMMEWRKRNGKKQMMTKERAETMKEPGWMCITDKDMRSRPVAKPSYGPGGNVDSLQRTLTTVSSSRMFTAWNCSPTEASYWEELIKSPVLCRWWRHPGSWLLCGRYLPSKRAPCTGSEHFCKCACVFASLCACVCLFFLHPSIPARFLRPSHAGSFNFLRRNSVDFNASL